MFSATKQSLHNRRLLRPKGSQRHGLLPTSHLDLVPQLTQNIGDLFALFALNFDHPILDRPAAAAGLLEFFRQRGQIPFRKHQPFDQRHALPAASLGFAMQIDRLLLRRQGVDDGGFLILFTQVAIFRRPDGFGVGIVTWLFFLHRKDNSTNHTIDIVHHIIIPKT